MILRIERGLDKKPIENILFSNASILVLIITNIDSQKCGFCLQLRAGTPLSYGAGI
jgi:hypothetical protein